MIFSIAFGNLYCLERTDKRFIVCFFFYPNLRGTRKCLATYRNRPNIWLLPRLVDVQEAFNKLVGPRLSTSSTTGTGYLLSES
jgi:hypothetical protein